MNVRNRQVVVVVYEILCRGRLDKLPILDGVQLSDLFFRC